MNPPRVTCGVCPQPAQGRGLDAQCVAIARTRQTVMQISIHLVQAHRLQLQVHGDAAAQLAQIRPLEHREQLGLAHEHDLQQLVTRGLQIGQLAYQLQAVDRQCLRIVDQQHAIRARRVLLQQESVQLGEQAFDAGRGGLQTKIAVDHAQQRLSLHKGVDHQRGAHTLRLHGIDQQPRQRGLAHAHIARHQHEALAQGHRAQQIFVALAQAR